MIFLSSNYYQSVTCLGTLNALIIVLCFDGLRVGEVQGMCWIESVIVRPWACQCHPTICLIIPNKTTLPTINPIQILYQDFMQIRVGCLPYGLLYEKKQFHIEMIKYFTLCMGDKRHTRFVPWMDYVRLFMYGLYVRLGPSLPYYTLLNPLMQSSHIWHSPCNVCVPWPDLSLMTNLIANLQ